MNFQALQICWQQLGQTIPMESVFTPPRIHGKKWEPQAFFASGQQEAERISNHLQRLGLTFPGGQALEFGCGLGRVTQALAPHFDNIHGVDIAPSILELAWKYNRYGNKCRYYLNQREDLQLFEDNTFNFVFSIITLQNMEPRYAKNYILEFTRVLAPGGLLLFQMPSNPATLLEKVKELIPERTRDCLYWLKYKGRPRVELHGIRRGKVVDLLERHHIRILDIEPDQAAYYKWSSYRYYGLKI